MCIENFNCIDKRFLTDWIDSCQNDNFRRNQGWKFRQNDAITDPVSLQWRHNWRDSVSNHQPHSGKAYEGTCRIPRQNGDEPGIASARFVWIVKAIESAARPHVVCGY